MSLDDEIRREGELNRAKQLREKGRRDTTNLSVRQAAELEDLTKEQFDLGYHASRRDRKNARKAEIRQRKLKKNRGSKSSKQSSGR